MIIRFSVENYLSFNERQTLDLTAVKTCKERREENSFMADEDNSLLKVVALYGANASGKSNLFYALMTMRLLVLYSASDQYALEDYLVAQFLFDARCSSKPATFELEFIVDGRWYKYGFSANRRRIESEWLFRRNGKGMKMSPLFVRRTEGDDDLINPDDSFEGADEVVVEKTRPNALFLSTCASFAVKEAMSIVEAIRNSVIYVSTQTHGVETETMFANGEQKQNILKFLQKSDPSIDDLIVEPYEEDTGRSKPSGERITRKRNRVIVVHRMSESAHAVRLSLYGLGSLGTQKAFELAGPIYKALSSGSTIFIDELDSRLHPILTREIIKLFNSSENNPYNAQLVFNTHDTNLLSSKCFNPRTQKKEYMLRRDQVYFVERDGSFASKLYSLIDFKDENGASVRNDASYEKEYLEGRYGSIPFVGDFSFIRDNDDGEA